MKPSLMLSVLLALLLLPVLLGGCAPGAIDRGDDDDDDDDSGVSVTDDSVGYYFGDSTFSGITDDWVLSSSQLVRRSLFPGESRITEELYDTSEGTANVAEMDVDAEAGTFSLVFADGSYSGSGTLTGEPWQWTGWSSVATHLDGSSVETTVTLTPQQLVASKLGRNTAGVPEWSGGQVLAVIEESEWLERYAQLPVSTSQ